MSYHILHLLSPALRVRVDLDRFQVENRDTGEKREVPMEDIALVIAASPDFILTAPVLRALAKRGVPLMICDEKYEPVSLVAPYDQPTDTALLRAQLSAGPGLRRSIWRRIIQAKIENQAFVYPEHSAPRERILRIARSRLLGREDVAEALASRIHWRYFFSRANCSEKGRKPGTRSGLNGRLDYGYAVMRSAVLRSLAARGFLTALGLHHVPRARGQALADDLVEPLRPFVDRLLLNWLEQGADGNNHSEWAQLASGLLTKKVRAEGYEIRLLYALDRYVNSLADCLLQRRPERLWVPRL